MPVQRYNDTFLGEGAVPGAGTMGGATPPAAPKNPGSSRVASPDGTENLRADATTLTAALPSTPNGLSDRRPAGVRTYRDTV